MLVEQIEFYEADANAYQAWLDELSADDNKSDEAVAFRERHRRMVELIDRLRPSGRVVELAAGTGRLSAILAAHASELVLVDSSPTSLGVAENRLERAEPPIDHVVADIFEWQPEDVRYDVVCFAAWLHHVPLTRFADFWARVDGALAPGGRVIFDFLGAHSETTEPAPPMPSDGYAAYHNPTEGVSLRDLEGTRWTVVHQQWEPSQLEAVLTSLGWRMKVELVEPDGFHWATAERLSD